jgi:hypothetical protein
MDLYHGFTFPVKATLLPSSRNALQWDHQGQPRNQSKFRVTIVQRSGMKLSELHGPKAVFVSEDS